VTEGEISRGAYGVVFRGRFNDQSVAVKQIHSLLLDDATDHDLQELLKGFLEEGRLLSSINHPHLVQGFGVYYDEKRWQPVILMELMITDLRTYLANNEGCLKLDLQTRICMQIALGVQFLHHLNPPFAHRDLTDKNVLLSDDVTVKIGDFGQSKYKNKEKQYFDTLAPGATVFMPPEALLNIGDGRARYTESIDIFSIGVLFMEVATGNYPYASGIAGPKVVSRFDHLKKMGRKHPLKGLVIKCLHNDYKKRPNIDQVVNEIIPFTLEYNLTQVGHDEEKLTHARAILSEVQKEMVDLWNNGDNVQSLAYERLEMEREELQNYVLELERNSVRKKHMIIKDYINTIKRKVSSKCKKKIKLLQKELMISGSQQSSRHKVKSTGFLQSQLSIKNMLASSLSECDTEEDHAYVSSRLLVNLRKEWLT
jgi:serine/threonine protein kinase